MRFRRTKSAPRGAAEIDRSNQFRAIWPKSRARLHGITVSEAVCGTGLGYLEHCIAVGKCRGRRPRSVSYGAHFQPMRNPDRRNGNEAQKRTYLPKADFGEHVGSLAMSGRARPPSGLDEDRAAKKSDRFVLNGNKRGSTTAPRPIRSWFTPQDRSQCRPARHDGLHRRKRDEGIFHRAEDRQARHARLRPPANWRSRIARWPEENVPQRAAAAVKC